ncbi:hypothetical protein QTP70_016916 [Hemibagrus guttatus]|uniref:Uncharacterized protein n=1 Tax=Hemibagrus guttatus TaxID=175788 RepID=A0AAE0QY33_9TELE|nr:hypothetical protein QTP70_016916 [Hemibagrus guttatus]
MYVKYPAHGKWREHFHFLVTSSEKSWEMASNTPFLVMAAMAWNWFGVFQHVWKHESPERKHESPIG